MMNNIHIHHEYAIHVDQHFHIHCHMLFMMNIHPEEGHIARCGGSGFLTELPLPSVVSTSYKVEVNY